MDIFVARQPIYDRDRSVYGYEILYRNSAENCARIDNPDQATSQVVANTLMDIGLEMLTDNRIAFINYTREFLLEDSPMLFPMGGVVIEILEDVLGDAAVVDAAKRLSALGYPIALDDFIYDPGKEQLIAVANIIKIDITQLTEDELVEHVRILKRNHLKLLAEKVETEEELQRCRDLGFDYFQGYFFCKPTMFKRQRMVANRAAVMQLISRLQGAAEERELQEIISRDVTLSYRLLRYINSAFFGLRQKIDSIHRAIVYLGTRNIKTWATIIALAGLNDKSDERMGIALVRARLCERVAAKTGATQPESYFTAGLLSVTDALLNMPMEEVVAELPLSDKVARALTNREGRIGATLTAVLAYERGEWEKLEYAPISGAEISEAWLEALNWSHEALLTIGIASQPASAPH